MFLPGVSFESLRPAAAGPSTRADVAMFVGCVGRRRGPLPEAIRAELEQAGWAPKGLFEARPERLDALLDIPVAVDSWSEFESLFVWDDRPLVPKSSERVPTPLGLAVKSFFEEGGARAYIVRTGDPLPLADPLRADDFAREKLSLLSWTADAPPPGANARAPILPAFGDKGPTADPADPKSWTGAALIYAVEDAAMLLLPDLIDLCSGSPRIIAEERKRPGPPEQFKPCAKQAPQPGPDPREERPAYRAPRLDIAGYRTWAAALGHALVLLGRPRGPAHRRDVTLVSACPLPLLETGFERGEEKMPLAVLGEVRTREKKRTDKEEPPLLCAAAAIGNARLQLGYPWIETAASRGLPEGLQSPEGLLAGLIARTALQDGAFRSAAGRPCRSVRRLHPDMAPSDIAREHPGAEADWQGARLSILARRREAVELLSDVTMADDPKWRAGGVSRLMGILLRASRTLGEELVFEPNGPSLWGRLRGEVEALLEGLWAEGALDGQSRNEAFEVTCDRTSMTKADIDAGRVICRIAFTAAYPIERILVSLLLLEAAPRAREAA